MYNEYNNRYSYNYGYGYPRKNRNNTVVDDEIISLNAALEQVKSSIGDEKKDELFYEQLINMAPDENSRDIISSIRDDEKKHNEILRFVYSNITGEVLESPDEKITLDEMTYIDSLEKAFLGEIAAVKKYRRIMGAMPNSKMHTLLMAIMTDEIRHASLYNYLIHKSMM